MGEGPECADGAQTPRRGDSERAVATQPPRARRGAQMQTTRGPETALPGAPTAPEWRRGQGRETEIRKEESGGRETQKHTGAWASRGERVSRAQE